MTSEGIQSTSQDVADVQNLIKFILKFPSKWNQ